MSSLSTAGRIALATYFFSRPIHVAWGLADGAWTVPADITGNETALRNEVGRRTATSVSYVTPDPAGAIQYVDGFYSVSATPTRHLYIRTDFDYADAVGAAIREAALFSGSVMVAGLPAGQKYFVPVEVASPGTLLSLQNFAPVYRLPDTRERFETILTF
jgi:hypothetical protein